MSYKIFISHAGEDTWVAAQLALHLEKFGATVFLDAENINVGDRFEDKLSVELKKSKELVVLFTPWSMDRPYVWLEIGAAWILDIRIVVVLYGLAKSDIIANPKMPIAVKGNDIITLNEFNTYELQLQKRINLNNNQ